MSEQAAADGWGAVFDAIAGGPAIRQQATKITKLKSAIAELVGLLRMGRELSESSRNADRWTNSGSWEHASTAVVRRDEILALYDAAIAKHGGEA